MTAQLLSALSAVIGGLLVGGLEEWRASRRARAADIDHVRRRRELSDLALGIRTGPDAGPSAP